MSGLLSGYYDERHEVPYFLCLGLFAIAVGLVLLALVKPICRLMHGVRSRGITRRIRPWSGRARGK
jgi:POT family proton-dependent oligopeptide transporter